MSQLMKAVEADDLKAVETLLTQGVDVNEKDAGSRNFPVIIAAYRGHDAILERLLLAKADLTVLDPGMKATALHAASYAGRTKAASLLIQHGIAIDQTGPFNGYTALHDAASQGHRDTVAVLLEGGADRSIRNDAGQTALEMAQHRGDQALIKLLSA